MFPRIALFIFLDILAGQISGYLASDSLFRKFVCTQTFSDGKSSSTNDCYITVTQVQQLLYGEKPYKESQGYRETIELASQLFEELRHRKDIRGETAVILFSISRLRDLEEQSRQGGPIKCDSDVLVPLVRLRKLMNNASGRNEFIDEPAKHPLNEMINDLTDILFKACSRDINDEIKRLRTSRHADKGKNEAKFALINMDRFQKFMKPPKTPVRFGINNIPFSFIAFDKPLIDVNTKLTPGDLKWLGVPQENTLSRNELLKRLMERTCKRIREDYSTINVLILGEDYAQSAYEIYKQTGKEYYFRSEIGYQRICRVLPPLMRMPEKKIS